MSIKSPSLAGERSESKKAPSRKNKKDDSFHFDIGRNVEGFKASIINHLKYTKGRVVRNATKRDWWVSASMAVRDRIMEQFIDTAKIHHEKNTRRMYYLSLEYLMGRLMTNNLYNTGLYEVARQAFAELGLNMEELCDEEVDMGLGNGGLGRLAACFLDSLATLEYPAIGYGIHYEFGLFRQQFANGQQLELPDNWLQFTNPWKLLRLEYEKEVHLYGRVENVFDNCGEGKAVWVDTKTIKGIPWDIPICGYGSKTVNFLRLWESRASEEFDLAVFNEGGYVEAIREKAIGEMISKVLYPNDNTESGKELRLVQQYFFVSCSLQDIIRRYKDANKGWKSFPDKVAVQLNDTHPAVAVLELMRLLVDSEGLEWDDAWCICRKVFSYTNHTLLPEALEKWSVPLFERVLPRHLQIVYEINRRFLEEEVNACWPGDNKKKSELSLIEETQPKMIRMSYLAVIASHAVNGVAALHTKLLKTRLFPSFNELYPNKFNNKTNGISPRRWLKACNPGLSGLMDKKVGTQWPVDLDQLRQLEKHADDPSLQDAFLAVKRENKNLLAQVIKEHCGLDVDPTAIFDAQIKRLHEYKRQHLNLLHILTLYRRLLHQPDYDVHPRVFIFGAKAAPGYKMAKCIIRAINAVGARINHDPRIQDKLKIAFLPNYSVTLAEKIIPATDLSEQISTAGKEASGTGNMKLALNGALTIGTLDGANIEIRDEVGEENIFIFGHSVEELDALREKPYDPHEIYFANEELRSVLDWLGSSYFTPNDPFALSPISQSLLEGGDPFFVLADYASYIKAQDRVDKTFRNRRKWARMAILNTARVGKFSSDRTIREYAEEIWRLSPLPIGD